MSARPACLLRPPRILMRRMAVSGPRGPFSNVHGRSGRVFDAGALNVAVGPPPGRHISSLAADSRAKGREGSQFKWIRTRVLVAAVAAMVVPAVVQMLVVNDDHLDGQGSGLGSLVGQESPLSSRRARSSSHPEFESFISWLFRLLPIPSPTLCAPAVLKTFHHSPFTPDTASGVPAPALALLKQAQRIFGNGFMADMRGWNGEKSHGSWKVGSSTLRTDNGGRGPPPELKEMLSPYVGIEIPATFTRQPDYFYNERCLAGVRMPLPPSWTPVCAYPVRCEVDIPVFPVLSEAEERRLGESGRRKDAVGRCKLVGVCEVGCAKVRAVELQIRLWGERGESGDGDVVWSWAPAI